MTSRNIALYLFLLSIALLPFHFFEWGKPQPASYVFLLAAIFCFGLRPELDRNLRNCAVIASVLAAFVFYVIIVNGVVTVSNTSTEPLVHILFQVFGLLTFIVCWALADEDYERFFQWLLIVIAATIIGQFVLALINVSWDPSHYEDPSFLGYRRAVYFNNPNQLGLFALLCSTTSYVLFHRLRSDGVAVRFNAALVAAVIACSGYLILECGSRASLAGYVVFVASLVVMPGHLFRNRLILVGLLAAVCAVAVASFLYLSDNISAVGRVLDLADDFTIDTSDEERGYQRILSYPEYLFFGAGEGLLHRFDADLELHSFFGTLLFSYGVLGLGCWLFVIGYLIYRGGFMAVFTITPILLYTITHNAGRVPSLWIFFAILAIATEPRLRRSSQSVQAHPQLVGWV